MKKLLIKILIPVIALLSAIFIFAGINANKSSFESETFETFYDDTFQTFHDDENFNFQMPSLKVNNKSDNSEIYLQSLDIDVDVTGSIATTKFTMIFKNRTDKTLEGELLFPLPEGVTVSGYALDINGKMRNAVPVEKAKATQVFEEIEHRRVDPGLLERVEGNNFRTRIYPFPAQGIRTVSISYEHELPIEKNAFRYRLPMDFKENIEIFSVKATVRQIAEPPQIDEKFDNELTFDKQETNYVASFSRKNYKPERSLIFAMPVPDNVPQVVMQSASGSYYFLASVMPKIETRKKQWSDNIGIIWDVSLSGMERDFKKEFQLLNTLIKEKKNLQISLYLLNNEYKEGGVFKITNGNWSDLQKTLENAVYDGGTNYSKIVTDKSSAKEFLLFSDGISTLSDADFVKSASRDKIVHCIVSSPKADYSALKFIAAQTGGKFINLNALSEEKIHSVLTYEALHFLRIENNNDVREVYPSISTPVYGNFSISGILDGQKTDITLLFGYGNEVTSKVTVKLDSKNASAQGNIYRIWAQKKINELDLQYEKNKSDLKSLGEQFGIVTRNTSLIVLETVQDYITYNIVPPAELQNEYLKIKKRKDDENAQIRKTLIEQAIASADDLKKWWNTDFKASPKKKYPEPDEPNVVVYDEERERLDVDEVVAPVTRQNNVMLKSAERRLYSASVDRISSSEEMLKDKSSQSTQPSIHLTPIKQDSEYIKQLTGKIDADYAIYLKIRPEYIGTPSFYFDMADWFFRLNDREKALRILTSIADLELENASLFRLLGYRFKEYGEYALEAHVCKKVIDWRPMEPQSYRDYALALSDAGKNQEALNYLYSILNQSFADHIVSRSSGIAEVIVTELNALISINKKLNISEINKKLINNMPVDIRIALNWNMNSTDIDLHVKDPNGETCYYSHNRTDIGGRISNDITQGYGPEQFLLKKAIKGKYKVFVNYFGDSQVKAEGPSTVMLEIFSNYSAENQQHKIVCLQMSKETKQTENGLIKVAEFEF